MSRYHHHYTSFKLRVAACVFEFIAFWLAIALGVHIGFGFSAHYQIPCVSITVLSYVNVVLF